MMNKSDIVKQDMETFRDEITRLRDATADALCRATETLHEVVFEAMAEAECAENISCISNEIVVCNELLEIHEG